MMQNYCKYTYTDTNNSFPQYITKTFWCKKAGPTKCRLLFFNPNYLSETLSGRHIQPQ